MFTGIIEEIGKLESISGGADNCIVRISADKVLGDAKLGDSIAVNGVCLTAVHIGSRSFEADVSRETIERTSFQGLSAGASLNLERALRVEDRLGGHIVTGHIDGTGKISSISDAGNSFIYKIAADSKVVAMMVEKGSVAIEGISLTIAGLDPGSFSISVIPHTRANTNLADKKPGDIVNLECDIIGKYIMRYVSESPYPQALSRTRGAPAGSSGKMTEAFLAENGFC